MMYVEFMKNIHLADSNEVMVVRLISDSEPKNVSLLLSRDGVSRVHKNFHLTDSKEVMAFRLISAY